MFIFAETDHLYDWISCLLQNCIYFGPFPNQRMINQLISEKFNVIINLTTGKEEIPYRIVDSPPGFPKTDTVYIHYPIDDHYIPLSEHSYCQFILSLLMYIKDGKKLYIHCRGGHGRSSMVCVSLIYMLNFHYTLFKSMEYTSECHNKRVILRAKWKHRRTPFNSDQYQFLLKIHKAIFVQLGLGLSLCNDSSKNSITEFKKNIYEWLEHKGPIIHIPKHPKYHFTLLGPCDVYTSLHDLYYDTKTTSEQKLEIAKSFYCNKLRDHLPKLRDTYLRKILVMDTPDHMVQEFYHNTISSIREKYRNERYE
jgi:hypothetical protein